MTMAEVAVVLDEDRDQETPAAIEEMGAEDPALIVFTSGTTGEPRGVVHAYRYLLGQRAQAEHWLGSRQGELVWCTTATGLVEVGAQRLPRPVADRRRRGHPRRAL